MELICIWQFSLWVKRVKFGKWCDPSVFKRSLCGWSVAPFCSMSVRPVQGSVPTPLGRCIIDEPLDSAVVKLQIKPNAAELSYSLWHLRTPVPPLRCVLSLSAKWTRVVTVRHNVGCGNTASLTGRCSVLRWSVTFVKVILRWKVRLRSIGDSLLRSWCSFQIVI